MVAKKQTKTMECVYFCRESLPRKKSVLFLEFALVFRFLRQNFLETSFVLSLPSARPPPKPVVQPQGISRHAPSRSNAPPLLRQHPDFSPTVSCRHWYRIGNRTCAGESHNTTHPRPYALLANAKINKRVGEGCSSMSRANPLSPPAVPLTIDAPLTVSSI